MFDLPFQHHNSESSRVPIVRVAEEFSSNLIGQRIITGEDTSLDIPPVIFRETFLKELDCSSAWETSSPFIIFDFSGVRHLMPSFAFHAFAYFRKYASPDLILKKIRFINISTIQFFTIEFEVTLTDEEYFERINK